MLLLAPLYYLNSVFNCSVILHLFRKKDIHFVSIDETRPLSEQGPFDIILHKVRNLVFLLRWHCSFGYLLSSYIDYIQMHLSGPYLLDNSLMSCILFFRTCLHTLCSFCLLLTEFCACFLLAY
jgi:hypothetical protein